MASSSWSSAPFRRPAGRLSLVSRVAKAPFVGDFSDGHAVNVLGPPQLFDELPAVPTIEALGVLVVFEHPQPCALIPEVGPQCLTRCPQQLCAEPGALPVGVNVDGVQLAQLALARAILARTDVREAEYLALVGAPLEAISSRCGHGALLRRCSHQCCRLALLIAASTSAGSRLA